MTIFKIALAISAALVLSSEAMVSAAGDPKDSVISAVYNDDNPCCKQP